MDSAPVLFEPSPPVVELESFHGWNPGLSGLIGADDDRVWTREQACTLNLDFDKEPFQKLNINENINFKNA